MILSGFGSLSGTHPTLRQGASGPDVTALQNALNTAGVQTPVTGTYDAYTADRVRFFQTAMALSPDGIAGPNTWAMLDKAVGVAITGGSPIELPTDVARPAAIEPANDGTSVIQLPAVGGVSKTAIAAIGLGIAAVAVLLFVKS